MTIIVEKRGQIKTYSDDGKLLSKVRKEDYVVETIDEEDTQESLEFGDERA